MKNNSIFITTLFIACTLLAIACGNNDKKETLKSSVKPAHLVSKTELIDIIVELHLLEAANANRLVLDSITSVNQPAYQEGIFKKHKTTRADFNASYNYYSANNDTTMAIYEEVVTRLSKLQAETVNQ